MNDQKPEENSFEFPNNKSKMVPPLLVLCIVD